MVPTFPILDLDDPQVRIELRLPVEMCIDLSLSGSGRIQVRDPLAVLHPWIDASWRWPEQTGATIQTVNLNENRARVIVPVP
jgi:hypothetical protein